MKKLFSLLVTSLLILSVMPMVLAASAGTTGGVSVDVDDPDDVCEAPKIYADPTSALLIPNAENTETAAIYDTPVDNNNNGLGTPFYPYDNTTATLGYQGKYRSDYIFTGEVMTYYVAVYDANGEDDIAGANVLVDDVAAGVCTLLNETTEMYDDVSQYLINEYGAAGIEVEVESFINDNFDLPVVEAYDYVVATGDPNYAFYRCDLLAVAAQTDVADVTFNAVDGGEVVCSGTPIIDVADRDDTLDFNPTLALTLTGGPLDFGSVQEGSVTLSNTVTLANGAEAGSDVMMDMYISAPDYFSSLDPTDYCPTALGMPADQFSYFATNGAADSSANDGATAVGLGLGGGICAFDAARGDFTHLPVDTTSVAGMCRIINTGAADGLLQEGELAMSITFRLDVPAVCEGTFDQGDFNFIGRVV